MCVHDNEQHASRTHSKRNKSLLANRIRVFSGERIVINKNSGCFRKGNAVISEVGVGLLWIPVDVHGMQCMDKRPPCQEAIWFGFAARLCNDETGATFDLTGRGVRRHSGRRPLTAWASAAKDRGPSVSPSMYAARTASSRRIRWLASRVRTYSAPGPSRPRYGVQ